MKTNAIYCGQAAKVLGNTLEFPDESVDLIYMDPPFFSNRNYEVLWGDGYELRAFEDRWQGGIENYISWLELILQQCHRVLKPTGTIYLHCDWHAGHYIKVEMDKIFGYNNFINEIVWHYNTGGASKTRFSSKHDTIFFYSKTPKYTFNAKEISEPYREGKTSHFTNTDEKGRKYRIRISAGIEYKYYLDEGRIPHDVWDVDTVNAVAKERLGYPTQKPEALLERIIKAPSNPGDVVLDPLCGCGTAIAVAQKLERKWVGIDVSPTACRLMVTRMRGLGVAIGENDIIGLPKTIEEIRAMPPFEFQNWVVRQLMGRVSAKKSGDMGIDGYLFDGTPMQVKQSERIGRNVVDNFETALRRAKRNKGLIVAFSFGRGAKEEVARVRNQDGIDIELKTVAEIMEEA
jgi:DNA modification methylase